MYECYLLQMTSKPKLPMIRSIKEFRWTHARDICMKTNSSNQMVSIKHVWDTTKPLYDQTIISTWLHCTLCMDEIYYKVIAKIPATESNELYTFGTIDGQLPGAYLLKNSTYWVSTTPYEHNV